MSVVDDLLARVDAEATAQNDRVIERVVRHLQQPGQRLWAHIQDAGEAFFNVPPLTGVLGPLADRDSMLKRNALEQNADMLITNPERRKWKFAKGRQNLRYGVQCMCQYCRALKSYTDASVKHHQYKKAYERNDGSAIRLKDLEIDKEHARQVKDATRREMLDNGDWRYCIAAYESCPPMPKPKKTPGIMTVKPKDVIPYADAFGGIHPCTQENYQRHKPSSGNTSQVNLALSQLAPTCTEVETVLSKYQTTTGGSFPVYWDGYDH